MFVTKLDSYTFTESPTYLIPLTIFFLCYIKHHPVLLREWKWNFNITVMLLLLLLLLLLDVERVYIEKWKEIFTLPSALPQQKQQQYSISFYGQAHFQFLPHLYVCPRRGANSSLLALLTRPTALDIIKYSLSQLFSSCIYTQVYTYPYSPQQ